MGETRNWAALIFLTKHHKRQNQWNEQFCNSYAYTLNPGPAAGLPCTIHWRSDGYEKKYWDWNSLLCIPMIENPPWTRLLYRSFWLTYNAGSWIPSVEKSRPAAINLLLNSSSELRLVIFTIAANRSLTRRSFVLDWFAISRPSPGSECLLRTEE